MMIEAVFNLRYAGSVGYYAAMLHYGTVGFDLTERYDKHRKALNRMDIVGPNGLTSLSASLQKPNASMRVADVQLSEHGNWRHNHWGALFSAYGRTPFFDYFADDLKRIYDDTSITTVAALDLELHKAVVEFLDLPIETVTVNDSGWKQDGTVADMRDRQLTEDALKPYYQIWADRHGFCDRLSILDLLFNVGREAIFALKGI